jgi:uncharacterized protein
MQEAVISDPVLHRLKEELRQLYGARLERVLLYGSRSRGDHTAESDYDVLVVLDPPVDTWAESERLARLSTRIGTETAGEVTLSLKAVTAAQLDERTGFMHNVRREARAI